MVMRSSLRWCGLAFNCRNGDVIRFVFIIDAFDREIIAWMAVANAGISGSDMRGMMLEAVEMRFGATRAPQTIEQVSDNGILQGAWHAPLCPGTQPDSLLHAGRQTAVEPHVGSFRQDTHAGLYPHLNTS
jgi:transposase InsO family protein